MRYLGTCGLRKVWERLSQPASKASSQAATVSPAELPSEKDWPGSKVAKWSLSLCREHVWIYSMVAKEGDGKWEAFWYPWQIFTSAERVPSREYVFEAYFKLFSGSGTLRGCLWSGRWGAKREGSVGWEPALVDHRVRRTARLLPSRPSRSWLTVNSRVWVDSCSSLGIVITLFWNFDDDGGSS